MDRDFSEPELPPEEFRPRDDASCEDFLLPLPNLKNPFGDLLLPDDFLAAGTEGVTFRSSICITCAGDDFAAGDENAESGPFGVCDDVSIEAWLN